MPTWTVNQTALTSSWPSGVVKPLARPHSQSITSFGASDSLRPPTVGQPSESPVPGEAECTTAKPRGTQVAICDLDISGRRLWWGISGGFTRFGGRVPTFCFGSQK